MRYTDIKSNPHFSLDVRTDEEGYEKYVPNRKVVKADEYIVFDGSAVESLIRYNNDDHVHVRFTQLGDMSRRIDELVPVKEDVVMHLATVESIEIKYTGIKEI